MSALSLAMQPSLTPPRPPPPHPSWLPRRAIDCCTTVIVLTSLVCATGRRCWSQKITRDVPDAEFSGDRRRMRGYKWHSTRRARTQSGPPGLCDLARPVWRWTSWHSITVGGWSSGQHREADCVRAQSSWTCLTTSMKRRALNGGYNSLGGHLLPSPLMGIQLNISGPRNVAVCPTFARTPSPLFPSPLLSFAFPYTTN